MTKTFCDRCGELVGKSYKKGDIGYIEEKTSTAFPNRWRVEFKIGLDDHTHWELCGYCADELIDMAHKQIVDRRSEKDNAKAKS